MRRFVATSIVAVLLIVLLIEVSAFAAAGRVLLDRINADRADGSRGEVRSDGTMAAQRHFFLATRYPMT